MAVRNSRQSKQNFFNSVHFPNPSAISIRPALAKIFRIITHDLKDNFAAGGVVVVSCDDMLAAAVALVGVSVIGETNRKVSNPSAAQTASGVHPAKHFRSVRPSSPFVIDSDGVLSSCAGQRAFQPSPLCVTPCKRDKIEVVFIVISCPPAFFFLSRSAADSLCSQ